MKKNKYLTFLENQELNSLKEDDKDYLGIRLKLALDKLSLSTGLVAILSNAYALYCVRNELIFHNPSFIETFSSSLGLYLEKFEHTDNDVAYQLIAENSKRNIAPPMLKNIKTGEYEIVTSCSQPSQIEVVDTSTRKLKMIDITQLGNIEWIMLNSPVFMKPVFRNLRECLLLSLKNQVIKNSYNRRHYNNLKEFQFNHQGSTVNQQLQQISKSRSSYLQGLKELETILDINLAESCLQLEKIVNFLNDRSNVGQLSREQMEIWVSQELNFQMLFEKEVMQNGSSKL